MRFSKPRPKALTVFFFSFQASDPRLTGRAHRVEWRAHMGILEKKLFSKGIPFFSVSEPSRQDRAASLLDRRREASAQRGRLGLQRIKRFLEVRDPPRYDIGNSG